MSVCKKKNIEITPSVFLKPAAELEKIIEVCNKNNIELKGNVLKHTAAELEKIIEICKQNNIEITGSVLMRKPKQLQENIKYIKENFGESYLTPLILSKNLKQLISVMSYLKELGVLEILKKSPSILALTLEEIKERKQILDEYGLPFVLENGKFNSIFGLSKNRYKEYLKKLDNNNTKNI